MLKTFVATSIRQRRLVLLHRFSNHNTHSHNHNQSHNHMLRMLKSKSLMTSATALISLNWDNSISRELPVERAINQESRSPIPDILYSYTKPTPVENPQLICTSSSALELLDIDSKSYDVETFVDYMSGNKLFEGTQPLAHCYCGHQFGSFSGQLGDGRAMSLGEIVNENGQRWELQLKGAGQTPYSRNSDGRAVLRSSIREFLCSEAMHALGIPSTRAASLITSSTLAVRDIHYNGNPIREKASIVLRLSPSFIRFGSFEVCKGVDPRTGRSGPSPGKYDMLKSLLDFTIKYHFAELVDKYPEETDRYLAFYREIIKRTAELVAEWQCVGFCHGVLNTDNMSIHGITIDYGPFGFLDDYNPDFICNASDANGRYSYENQPSICGWNLGKLGETLSEFVPLEQLQTEIEKYEDLFKGFYHKKMCKKIGLLCEEPTETDPELVASLLETMQATGADFTNTFRNLNIIQLCTNQETSEENNNEFLNYILTQTSSPSALAQTYKPQYSEEQLLQLQLMASQNPMLLAMLGQDREFIELQVKKLEKYKQLKDVDSQTKQKNDKQLWTKWLEKYRKRLAHNDDSEDFKSDTSKDSTQLAEINAQRKLLMDQNNPKYILRNYIAETAIKKAKSGDYSEVKRVFELLQKPYEDQPEFEEQKYDQKPPDWSLDLSVT